ncbi:hypothetical protein NE237_002552 [Protea cynaroides]|uniref:KIB1-4 beta-propeller domain-containing protein n=1 Tax=Protea cynaroides TaxID=273540 RepID=A0A9Q0KW44_9MAGN|nr:hypothetical protein NE237_002552 [Protea cynaroides]
MQHHGSLTRNMGMRAETGALSFLDLPETMIHHVRTPQINMNLCCGSSEGWLFMFADDAHENYHCFLLNLISKVILSSSPDINEDWMVVAHTVSHGLLFYIIFSGGLVYGLSMLNSVWVFDMKTQNHALMSGGASSAYDLYHSDENRHGDLHIYHPNTGYHYTTIKFLLYKLKENDNKELRMGYVWVRKSSFGVDQAMFISTMGSKSVSTIKDIIQNSNEEIIAELCNCTYFINDLHRQTSKPGDIGIYHVEEGKIEPFIPFDSYDFKFSSVWVTCTLSLRT